MPDRHLKAVPDLPADVAIQPPLPIEPPKPGRRTCAWCGKPATTTIMVAPPTFGSHKGKRVLKKSGTYADACREHRRNAYNPYAQPAANRGAARAERRRLELASQDQLTIQDAFQADLEDLRKPPPGKPAS